MKQTRRSFMTATAALAGALALPNRPWAQAAFAPLTARPATVQLAPPDFAPTDIWGHDSTAPGPVIRVPQGGRVQRRFVNDLPQASSVHWHGIRIDNAMDGVQG